MTTTIYTCGKELTAKELFLICSGYNWKWFPEVTTVKLAKPKGCITIPKHPSELHTMLPGLIDTTFVTVSKHLILLFLQHVRHGHIKPGELVIYCVDRTDLDNSHPPGRRIWVDMEGNLIDGWPEGLFYEQAEILS